MKPINKTRHLYYYDEGKNSDKVYNVYLLVEDDGCYVHFEYGRRGKDLVAGTKTPEPVSYEEGLKIYENLIASKSKKGYIRC